MTYSEVLWRMIELMFIPSTSADEHGRWIHSSYADRLSKILYRTNQRFSHHTVAGTKNSGQAQISEELHLTNPAQVVEGFVNRFPKIETQLMAAEDVDYFLYLAREGGKPVNFIPVIDKGLFMAMITMLNIFLSFSIPLYCF